MTKADKCRHELSQAQVAAVELVAIGKPDAEVAEAVQVTRQTVNVWRHHDYVFVAAVNARRRELWSDARERLQALTGRAVDALAQAVEGGNVNAALAVLKAAKELPEPCGPITPEAVLKQRAEELVNVEDAATPMTFMQSLDARNEDSRAPRVAQAMQKLRAEVA